MMQQQKHTIHVKKLSTLPYEPLRQISHLSPYHERVIMQKKYLEEKQHLRSILIMGHLQKMELNAINNRSIETIRKMKAAEDMSKKRLSSKDSTQNRLSLKKLKIDSRKKTKDRTKSQTLETNQSQKNKIQKIQEIYEKLIDDYVKQVSKEKLLQKGFQRTKIIQQACQTIKAQMSTNFPGLEDRNQRALRPLKILNQKRKTLSNSSNHINLPSISHDSLSAKKSNRSSNPHQGSILVTNENLMIGQICNKNVDNILPRQRQASCYRSLTEVECKDNLKQLEFQKNYLSKQRMRNQKLFLRKMKLIGAKSIKNLQRNSPLE